MSAEPIDHHRMDDDGAPPAPDHHPDLATSATAQPPREDRQKYYDYKPMFPRQPVLDVRPDFLKVIEEAKDFLPDGAVATLKKLVRTPSVWIWLPPPQFKISSNSLTAGFRRGKRTLLLVFKEHGIHCTHHTAEGAEITDFLPTQRFLCATAHVTTESFLEAEHKFVLTLNKKLDWLEGHARRRYW